MDLATSCSSVQLHDYKAQQQTTSIACVVCKESTKNLLHEAKKGWPQIMVKFCKICMMSTIGVQIKNTWQCDLNKDLIKLK